MDINDKSILILGAYGQVGSAIVKLLLANGRPGKLILCSLWQEEADEICEQCTGWVAEMQHDVPPEKRTEIMSRYGDILRTRHLEKLHARTRETLDEDGKPLTAEALRRRQAEYTSQAVEFVFKDYNLFSAADKQDINLYRWLAEDKPDIMIDCVNTATGLAYMDIFTLGKSYLKHKEDGQLEQEGGAPFAELVLASAALPSLIRHVEILKDGLEQAGTGLYLKVGTTGTGGMGLNIPYTHSESKPSRQLMSKSAVAGASSLLYLLFSRTKDAPVIKEIKPAALIGWKGIGYGPIRKHGQPIALVNCQLDQGRTLDELRSGNDAAPAQPTGEELKGVYIDTGENGVFSAAEFEAITAIEQMELVTAEDCARVAVGEIMGESTGFDIVGSISSVCLDSTYRGGVMRNLAIGMLEDLQREHGQSVAYEILGPPKLSKLLWEAYLLKDQGRVEELLKPIFQDPTADLERRLEMLVEAFDPAAMCEQITAALAADNETRQRILSIGIPICTNDMRWVYGPTVALMRAFPGRTIGELLSDAAMQRYFLDNGAVELLPGNMERWHERLRGALKYHYMFSGDQNALNSSAYDYRRLFTVRTSPEGLVENVELHIGELLGWLFVTEEHGSRRRHFFHPGSDAPATMAHGG
jgi:hypothetical protein